MKLSGQYLLPGEFHISLHMCSEDSEDSSFIEMGQNMNELPACAVNCF